MAEVDPGGDEEGEIGANQWVVDIVQGFGGLAGISPSPISRDENLLQGRNR
jgi:hypothetical protein